MCTFTYAFPLFHNFIIESALIVTGDGSAFRSIVPFVIGPDDTVLIVNPQITPPF